MITISSSFPRSIIYELGRKSKEYQKLKQELTNNKQLEMLGKTFHEYIKDVYKNKVDFFKTIFDLANIFPELQFAIKLHPADNFVNLKNYIGSVNKSNIFIINKVFIWDFLNVSDLHIQRQCTTAVEAALLNKKVLELSFIKMADGDFKSREKLNINVNSFSDLIEKLKQFNKNQLTINESLKKYRKEHLKTFFGLTNTGATKKIGGILLKFYTNNFDKSERRSLAKINLLLKNWKYLIKYFFSIPADKSVKETLYLSKNKKFHLFDDKLVTLRDVNNFEKKYAKYVI